MSKLTRAISTLEQEIEQNKQAVYLQFQFTKMQAKEKLSSPPVFLLSFVVGALIGKRFKNKYKRRGSFGKVASTAVKLSFLQKIMALSSEITLAVNLFNRFKRFKTNFIKQNASHPDNALGTP